MYRISLYIYIYIVNISMHMYIPACTIHYGPDICQSNRHPIDPWDPSTSQSKSLQLVLQSVTLASWRVAFCTSSGGIAPIWTTLTCQDPESTSMSRASVDSFTEKKNDGWIMLDIGCQ